LVNIFLSAADHTEFLASQGITFLPDPPTSKPATKSIQAVRIGNGNIRITPPQTLKISQTSATASTSIAVAPLKQPITRIVRLNAAGVNQGTKAPTLKILSAGSQTLSTTSGGPKIIKVTPEQFEALKSGIRSLCSVFTISSNFILIKNLF
jgi:hypothetical protein